MPGRRLTAVFTLALLALAACATPSTESAPAAPATAAATLRTVQPSGPPDAAGLLAEGDRAFNRSEFAGAGEAYAEAERVSLERLALDPDDVDARLDLGQAYDRLGRIAQVNADAPGARSAWTRMAATAEAGLARSDADPDLRLLLGVAHGRLAALGGEDREAQLTEMRETLAALDAEGALGPEERRMLALADDALAEGVGAPGDPYVEIDQFDPDPAFAAGDYDAALQIGAQRLVTAAAFFVSGDLDAAAMAAENGSQAWRALFARELAAAEAASRRGLALDPGQTWIATNLAHALMFQGRTAEADAVYDAHRGATLSDDPSQTWEAVVASDFAALRAAGLAHPHMDAVLARFAGRVPL